MFVIVLLVFHPMLAATSVYKLVTSRQFRGHGQGHYVHIWRIHKLKKGEKNPSVAML